MTMKTPPHPGLSVRHDCLERRSRPNLFAADDERDVELFAPHLLEAHAQLLALGRAGRVVLDRLVLRRRWTEKARCGRHSQRL